MAQTGYTPILIYSSSTGGNAPVAGNLANSALGSELAINITDGKLFYKDNANAVQVIGWKTTPTTAGGTGLTSYTAGDLLYYVTGTTLSKLAIGSSGQWLGSSGTAPQWNAPAALTKTDDTNVTLTLGGSASTALLNAASLTLGWTGQLATTRGGTGLSSFSSGGILYASSTSALATSANFTFGVDRINLSYAGPTYIIQTNSATPNNVVWSAGNTNAVLNSANGYQWEIQTAGSTKLTVDNSSNVTVNSGNLIIGTSGKGIDFSANSHAAGMTSELLNWYEEGTWTPTVAAGVGAITTYTSSGYYTRIGRQVTATFIVAVTNNGTGASYLTVTGQPFTQLSNVAIYGYNQSTGTSVVGQLTGGTMYLYNYAGLYPVATGQTFNCTVIYFI